ncbi:TPA: HBL/NHE enterotoxin family protein [Bacillus cereus]|nr:HBL/NHE enterotoxin family protein [Bacillus cereus]
MRKIPTKILTTSALVTALLTSCIVAPVASAETGTIQVKHIQQQVNSKDMAVSQQFKDQLQSTNSNVLVIETYANTVLTVPAFNLAGLDTRQIAKVNIDLSTAQNNARQWLNVIKPGLIYLNQDVINFSNRYESYSEDLKKAVNTKDKVKLADGLKRLAANAANYEQKAKEKVTQLQGFRDKLGTDASNFTTSSNAILTVMSSRDQGLPSLLDQIKVNQDNVNKGVGLIVGGSVLLAAGVGGVVLGTLITVGTLGGGTKLGLLVGGLSAGGIAGGSIMIKQGNDLMNASRDTLVRLVAQKTEWEQQAIALTYAQKNIDTLKTQATEAVTATQGLANEWSQLGAKFNGLAQAVELVDLNDINAATWIKADIDNAKLSWKDIKDFANSMSTANIEVKN